MSRSGIREAAARDEEKKGGPVYFWRPHDVHGYLSQWYHSKFKVDGDEYATAEMWMMVSKARLFGDEDIAKKMLKTNDAQTHKALGRKVAKFDTKVWDDAKSKIVEEGNYHKFTISNGAQGMQLMLLATGDRELVEANPMDRIWGVGFADENAGQNRHRWGQNLLGKALEVVRGRLREEAKAKAEAEAKDWDGYFMSV
ncbi:DUF1768-domain-containing protein [Pleomassaria siparia CBS 279.74]|uniref:DUF1768-domain-containing protein n=1 Tax=Pleomassaria siparia CBS 279.74 TaxID=1314801 RepID=A0A6G1KHS8_9PLEO|nr:DUF1768-domain-containing protein [Pleomassaria siparia CBS 279.74]